MYGRGRTMCLKTTEENTKPKKFSHAWNNTLYITYKALSDVLTWNNVMKQTHYSKKYIVENTKVVLHNKRKHHFGMYKWQNDKTNHLLNIVLRWTIVMLKAMNWWVELSSYPAVHSPDPSPTSSLGTVRDSGLTHVILCRRAADVFFNNEIMIQVASLTNVGNRIEEHLSSFAA